MLLETFPVFIFLISNFKRSTVQNFFRFSISMENTLQYKYTYCDVNIQRSLTKRKTVQILKKKL